MQPYDAQRLQGFNGSGAAAHMQRAWHRLAHAGADVVLSSSFDIAAQSLVHIGVSLIFMEQRFQSAEKMS